MQINRLFELLYLLLERDNITAKELAARFEVSTRTIYRDVEALSAAGIPVYMSQGKGGGIRLLPQFVLNKALLTEEEKREILSALQSLTAAEHGTGDTLAKLSQFLGQPNAAWVEIDYSDWGNLMQEPFETAKKAILSRTLLVFDYRSANGVRTRRKVEPVTLWFKEKTWYLKGYCLTRQEMRTFRLSRMSNVLCTGEHFLPRAEALQQERWTSAPPPAATEIKVKIDPSQEYRVYDEFPEKDISRNSDGSFTVTMRFIEDEWVYGYLLSFGPHAVVLSPQRIKRIVQQRLQETLAQYL